MLICMSGDLMRKENWVTVKTLSVKSPNVQKRRTCNPTNSYLPESYLPSRLDLVIRTNVKTTLKLQFLYQCCLVGFAFAVGLSTDQPQKVIMLDWSRWSQKVSQSWAFHRVLSNMFVRHQNAVPMIWALCHHQTVQYLWSQIKSILKISFLGSCINLGWNRCLSRVALESQDPSLLPLLSRQIVVGEWSITDYPAVSLSMFIKSALLLDV